MNAHVTTHTTELANPTHPAVGELCLNANLVAAPPMTADGIMMDSRNQNR